jgi:hypothetical protein
MVQDRGKLELLPSEVIGLIYMFKIVLNFDFLVWCDLHFS